MPPTRRSAPPTHAARGTRARARSSIRDRVKTARGGAAVASAAAGTAANSVATTPRTVALARTPGLTASPASGRTK